MKYVLLCFFALLPAFSYADQWGIDAKQSHIQFSGTHAGNEFEGVFETWSGEIAFNPKALEQATARIEVDLTSAITGNKTYDGTLPQKDWLASKLVPNAVFEAKTFTHLESERYKVEGVLSLRGVEVPVSLMGRIAIRGDAAHVSMSTTLRRLDYGIGEESDASGEWVSLKIPLSIKIVATRTQ